jgi:HSP20 family protein
MTLVRWSPAKELDAIRRDMERLFGDVVEPFGRRRVFFPRLTEREGGLPSIDMYDRKNEIVVKAALPGVEKENVDLTITNDSVTIKGETKKESEVKEEDYYCSECTYGSFVRTIALPKEVDASKAKATFKNGMLEITLPKLEEAKAKEVKLKIE